jgi:hypothetical protein
MSHMKHTIKRTLITGAALAILVAPAVSARDGSSGSGSGSLETETEVHTSSTSPSPSLSSTVKIEDRKHEIETELHDQLEQQQEARQAKIGAKISELKQKLDDNKKKACDNHEATINRLMKVMDTRRQTAFDRIGQIATAVQQFKDKKQLTVENYDELVAKVAAAKSVAEQAIAAQQAIPNLNCDGDHPRADVTDFKLKKDTAKDAVRAYRDAVKALVKAVKTSAESLEASPSPSPEAES